MLTGLLTSVEPALRVDETLLTSHGPRHAWNLRHLDDHIRVPTTDIHYSILPDRRLNNHRITLYIIAEMTFTVTAFPSVLYLCESLTPAVQSSGKPCNRSHSRGVRRRTVMPSSTIGMWAVESAPTLPFGYVTCVPWILDCFSSCLRRWNPSCVCLTTGPVFLRLCTDIATICLRPVITCCKCW